jgi:hypothetical protein
MADKKKIILAVLAVISVFVWMRGMAISSKSGRTKLTPGVSSAFAARQARRSEYKDYKRNPFVTVSISRSQGEGLQLVGIISDENGLYALINDQIAHLGDKIGEYAVIDIRQGKVILNDGAKNIELTLQE